VTLVQNFTSREYALLADHVKTGLTGHRIVAHGNARSGLDVQGSFPAVVTAAGLDVAVRVVKQVIKLGVELHRNSFSDREILSNL